MSDFTGNRTRLGLAVVCVAQFVVVLDATIVTTALPAIRGALGFAAADLPWVITSYTLVFGGVLITGGRVADVLGARRTFKAGLTAFCAGSVGCATAVSPAMLVGMRAVQGLGAALLSPAALALLTRLTPTAPERRRAVAWWTAAAATGGASGWMLGGLLTEYLGWRTVFWVNLPICLLALRAARALPLGAARRRCRLDITGAALVTAGPALLVYGLTRIGEDGPLRPSAWAPLLLAACLGALLVRHLRSAADPLLPPLLLRSRVVAGSNVAALALTATTTPAMYLSTLYVRQVLGLSAARASLLFPVFNVAVIAGSLAGPRMLHRLGSRSTVAVGFSVIAGGTVVCSMFPGSGNPVGQVLAAFALMGAGLGTASVASTHAGTEGADPAWRGVASGVLNSSAQIGTALGLAILTPLATSAGAAAMTGYRSGFIGTGVIALAGLGASLLLPGLRRPAREPATAIVCNRGFRKAHE